MTGDAGKNAAPDRHEFEVMAADGGRIAITRVGPAGRDRIPVVMIAGMFTAHSFWISPRNIGLAAFLAEQGYCCYLVDRRGMGRSPAPANGVRAGLQEHVDQDLPALLTEITKAHTAAPFWVGHSFGGVMASLALGSGRCGAASGLLLFATQYAVGKRALTWPYSLFTRGMSHALGRVPARRAGLGPEDEDPSALDDACRWVRDGRRGGSIAATLRRVDCSVMGMVGISDRVDPPAGCERFIQSLGSQDRQFHIAGQRNGFAEDYNHPGVVVSRAARDDIWPRVGDWLAARQPGTT